MWSLRELQELLDEWIIAAWQNRPHDGLRDPPHPGRAFTPNEKYAAMVEAAGYVPVALSADDYVELLPARWQAVNAYGVKINHRTYDGEELNPFRRQPSGVKEQKNLWEVHYDPYDVSRIWVRDHWNGGWITVFWTQLHRVAAPFGEMAWDHARSRCPGPPRKSSPTPSTACSAGPARDPATAAGRAPRSRHAGPPRRRPHQGRPAAPASRTAAQPTRTSPAPGEPDDDGGPPPGDPDADLRPLHRGGQTVVTAPPGPDGDPRLQALTTLTGWRQFASEMPASRSCWTGRSGRA